MKPRIRLRFGVWCCISMWPFICGCGYSPRAAYDEWEDRTKERV